MGMRQSTPKRVERTITPRPRYPPAQQQPQYTQVPQQSVGQPIYDTNGNIISQKTVPMQPMQPIIYDTHHDDEYLDVVGSDSGNMTVFSWITQLSTCCSSLCTLVVLIAFVVWMFLNRSINTLP